MIQYKNITKNKIVYQLSINQPSAKENRKQQKQKQKTHKTHQITQSIKQSMQQLHSPKSYINEQPLISARSGSRDFSYSHDNTEQDLELLIRAHQRIRQLEDENQQVKEEQMRLIQQVSNNEKRVNEVQVENDKLSKLNQELLTRMLQLEKQLNSFTVNDYQQAIKTQKHQTTSRKSHLQLEQLPEHQQLQQPLVSQQFKVQSPQQSKFLRQSQSTPVILNINLNPFSRQQRQSFLSSCKQQFAQQLSKIKQSQVSASNHYHQKFPSQYFPVPVSNKTSQLHVHRNNFAKQAEQQFFDQNSKTLKNIYLTADRRKSASSTSGSLIRKNFIAKRYGDQDKVIFGDRTNVWNSKYASINQIMGGCKGDPYSKNCQSGLKIYPTAVQSMITALNSTGYKGGNQKKKSIYFKSESNSKMQYDKNGLKSSNNCNNNKRKEIQLQLRNRQQEGIIKYRGLCL